MKLGLKIILPILLLLVIVTGAFGYIFYNLKQQESVLSTEGAKIRALNALNERLSKQQDITVYNVLAYRFNRDGASLLAISQSELDKSKTLDEMYPFITTPYGRELINNYIDTRKEIETLRNELIRAIDEGDREQIVLNYNKWNIQTQNVKATLADIGAYNINSLEKTLTTVGDIRNKISGIIVTLVFIVIAIILFLFLYLRIVITTPIIKLAEFADKISQRNFTTTTTTTTTTRKDELGTLSRAFSTMVERLKESHATLEKKVQDRTKELEHDKAKDEAMLSSIGDGLIVTDKDANIVYVNKVFEKMLGWKAEDIIRKSLPEVIKMVDINGQEISKTERLITKTLRDKTTTTTHATVYYLRKDKTPFPVALTVSPILMRGNLTGAVEVFRDITREKEIDKAKSEFVSLASHQLRTPLTAVSWYTEMILTGAVGAVIPKQKKYLEEIYQGNNRMIELVNTLLDVSRIELGTLKFEPKPTDILALARSVLDEQKPKIKKKKLIVVEKLSKGVPIFLVDPKLLRMVFQNLLANSVEYTPEGGKIEFGISLDKDGQVLITVSDTGYGIPKNQQDKIFTKLFRADNVREKDTGGTGLGLYIVKSIVENSGGKIWFESEENKGSTFYVTLLLGEVKVD